MVLLLSYAYSTILHYPLDQLVKEHLRYPDWFASGSVVNPVYYSNLTATRMKDVEIME
jgi:hypothetical protein